MGLRLVKMGETRNEHRVFIKARYWEDPFERPDKCKDKFCKLTNKSTIG